ncbi:MAG: hypothetical protein ACRC0Y_13845, partial [Fusobacteriaceae bacterium]
MNGTEFDSQSPRAIKRKKRKAAEKRKIKSDLEKIFSGIRSGLTIFKELEENSKIEENLKN